MRNSQAPAVTTVITFMDRCWLTLVFSIAISMVSANAVVVVGQDDKDPPVIGDIIKYVDRGTRSRYGLIVELDFNSAWLEYVGRDGQIERDLVIGKAKSWEFVDRFHKKKIGPKVNRVWNSANGKFKIVAKMLTARDDKVRLEKKDGTIIAVEIGKLSSKDQEYVEQNRKHDADKQNGVDPNKDFPPQVQRLIARRNELLEIENAGRQLEKDAAKVKSLPLKKGGIVLEMPAQRPAMTGQMEANISGLPSTGRIFNIKQAHFAGETGRIAFATGNPFGRQSVLTLVDIAAQDVVAMETELADRAEVVAISPSGNVVLVFSDPPFDIQRDAQLEVWRLEGDTLKRHGIVPFDSVFAPRVFLFSDSRGVLSNDDGLVTFFDITDRLVPTHSIPGGGWDAIGSIAQVCHDGKTVLYYDGRQRAVFALDGELKKCLGGFAVDTGDSRIPQRPLISLTPDGKSLGFCVDDQLSVYSLATGQVTRTCRLPVHVSRHSEGGIQWINERTVLLSGRRIIDLELEAEIGRVTDSLRIRSAKNYVGRGTRIYCDPNADHRSRIGAGRGSFAGSRPGSSEPSGGQATSSRTVRVNVGVERLPNDQIVALSNRLTPSDVVELDQNDKVKLTIDLGQYQRSAQRIRDKVKEDLLKGGVELAPSSDFELKLTYRVGEPETHKYTIIGGLNTRERTETLTPQNYSAVMTFRGEVIWSRHLGIANGRAWSVEGLNDMVKQSKRITPDRFLEFQYPSQLRVVPPGKRGSFEWN